MEHHNLPATLPTPSSGDSTEQALAKIFDIMLHSLGIEKRYEMIKEAEDYIAGLPPDLPPKPKIYTPMKF
jgi:hypothetical protein